MPRGAGGALALLAVLGLGLLLPCDGVGPAWGGAGYAPSIYLRELQVGQPEVLRIGPCPCVWSWFVSVELLTAKVELAFYRASEWEIALAGLPATRLASFLAPDCSKGHPIYETCQPAAGQLLAGTAGEGEVVAVLAATQADRPRVASSTAFFNLTARPADLRRHRVALAPGTAASLARRDCNGRCGLSFRSEAEWSGAGAEGGGLYLLVVEPGPGGEAGEGGCGAVIAGARQVLLAGPYDELEGVELLAPALHVLLCNDGPGPPPPPSPSPSPRPAPASSAATAPSPRAGPPPLRDGPRPAPDEAAPASPSGPPLRGRPRARPGLRRRVLRPAGRRRRPRPPPRPPAPRPRRPAAFSYDPPEPWALFLLPDGRAWLAGMGLGPPGRPSPSPSPGARAAGRASRRRTRWWRPGRRGRSGGRRGRRCGGAGGAPALDEPAAFLALLPSLDCPGARRLGATGAAPPRPPARPRGGVTGRRDGGKWVCGVEELRRAYPCVVYSFGSHADPSFELAVRAEAAGCEAHTFDPFLNATGRAAMEALGGALTFHAAGVAGSGAGPSGALRTLGSIASGLGHGALEVLKMDVEGAEFGVLEDLLAGGPGLPAVRRLLVEVHHAADVAAERGPQAGAFYGRVAGLVADLEARLGLLLHSVEVNARYHAAAELSFYRPAAP
eukprot:tig00001003_g6267.t1